VNQEIYDVIIIGSGPAGLTAGIYTCRSQLKSLLIECYSPASQAVTADCIENYPGFPEGVNGFELIERFKNQAKNFGLDFHADKVDNMSLEELKEIRKDLEPLNFKISEIIKSESESVVKSNKGTQKIKGVSYQFRIILKSYLFNKLISISIAISSLI